MHTATVIIPVAEWRWFVKRAVFSALDQGETVSEVLLVDNADDHLDKSFREELLADNRVRIVVSDIKNNAARARNLGIRETKSEFIAVLDSDDEYLADHIPNALNTLTSCNGDFFCSAYLSISPNGSSRKVVPDSAISTKQLIQECNIGHSTVVYRTSLNFEYPEIGSRHDYAAWLKIFSRKVEYVFSNKIQVLRHERPTSLSSGSLVKLAFKQVWVTFVFSNLPATQLLLDLLIFFFRKLKRYTLK